MKLLIVGDLHIRGDNPRNRIGNYYTACKTKLEEVFQIAQKNGARVIQVGDVCNSPNLAYSLLADLARFLSEYQSIYCIAGNHDTFAHNLNTLPRTALGFMYALDIIKHVDDLSGPYCQIIGRDFNYNIDQDYSEYITPEPAAPQILVVHGMLLEHSPGFEIKHSTIPRVAEVTNAHCIISGHYHLPFCKRHKDKLFINPGALMRIQATEEEINRIPQVVLLDTNQVTNPEYMPEIIPLKTAKPGSEVLDKTQIEVNEARQESMRLFIESLEFNAESKFMNVQEIIETLATKEGFTKQVAFTALEKISNVRERLKCQN